jgi:two-component sensor histidine kinase
MFALLAGVLVAYVVASDREATLDSASERTRSMSRLLAAHGDATIEDANKMVASVVPLVEQWDLSDPTQGQRIFDMLRGLAPGSPQIAAVGVLDAQGTTRVSTWSFPSKPVNVADRVFFKAHLAGEAGPLILGDSKPGAVSGKPRFTFSRALYNPDGSLKAVVVASIYNAFFERLYAETVTWPGARTGLYVEGAPPDASILARLATAERATPAFRERVSAEVKLAPSGTLMLKDGSTTRIVSWQRSERYPRLFATASQPVDAALAQWRWRSGVVGLSAALAIAGFAGLAVFAVRAAEAREAERFKDTLALEVHHRVKNSLQIVTGLLSMRAGKSSNPEVKEALRDGARQVSAIASVHEMLQLSGRLDRVEVGHLVAELCSSLERGAGRSIAFHAGEQLLIDPSQASTMAVICNELVTNAIKHAREGVEVSLAVEGEDLVLTVRDDGPGLPSNFEPGATGRFGLVTAARLCAHIRGRLSWGPPGCGAVFHARLPVRALV